MRIYTNLIEAVKETERDLWEMGIRVHPQTMQDKWVAKDKDYNTVEIRGYGFKIANSTPTLGEIREAVNLVIKDSDLSDKIVTYILCELEDRMSGKSLNPGNSCQHRLETWNEFLHNGHFSYTYSERITPQLREIIYHLHSSPQTRQAILNIHSNICPAHDRTVPPAAKVPVTASIDLQNSGGKGRIPCSMYYQFMIREGALDLIYTMRSCDFLVHFIVDVCIALLMQEWMAKETKRKIGVFTYFTGSLHAYQKDMKERGIF